jgi:protein SCO1/2
MKVYADSLKVDTNMDLAGPKDSLYSSASLYWMIPKTMLKNQRSIHTYSILIALIDKDGKVRGQVYDGLKADELKKN